MKTIAITAAALAATTALVAAPASAETYYMHGFFGWIATEPTTGPNVIEYPNTDWYWGRGIRQGEANLDAQIGSLPAGSTVIGISEGSIVVSNWLRDHADDEDAPSPDDIRFVLAAPSCMPGGLIYTVLPEGTWVPIAEQTVQQPAETPYDVDVVRMEYDGWADFPKYWYVNPLAAVNAIVGMFYQAHGATPTNPDVYQTVPHYSETNSAGGTTTNYLVPNPVLPLTAPLRLVGVPDPIVDQIDNVLRPVIDSGYDRSAYTEAETSETTAPATAASEVEAAAPTRKTSTTPKRTTRRNTASHQTSTKPATSKKKADHPAGKPESKKQRDQHEDPAATGRKDARK